MGRLLISTRVVTLIMFAAFCTVFIWSIKMQAQPAEQAQIDKAVQIVKDLCLVGTQYDLYVDAKGNIVIKSLRPGGEGSVIISSREAKGAPAVYDEKLRIIADAQTRDCTKAHIPEILREYFKQKDRDPVPQPPPNPPKHKYLDQSIPLLHGKQYWKFHSQQTSINGKFFENYGLISSGPSKETAITFDIRGWNVFEGYAGITKYSSKEIMLVIQVDENVVASHQLQYDKNAIFLQIPLADAKTLTFKRSERTSPVVIGEPKLSKSFNKNSK